MAPVRAVPPARTENRSCSPDWADRWRTADEAAGLREKPVAAGIGRIRANYITRRETSKQGLCRNLTINARPCECRKVAQFRACMANHGIGGIVGERHVAQERHPVVLHRFVRTLLAGNRGGWWLG